MSDAGTLAKKSVTVLCLVGTAAVLYNVYSDNRELRQAANQLACGASGCARLLGASRNPFTQSFTFQVSDKRAETRAVNCQRRFVLFGAYTCKLSQ